MAKRITKRKRTAGGRDERDERSHQERRKINIDFLNITRDEKRDLTSGKTRSIVKEQDERECRRKEKGFPEYRFQKLLTTTPHKDTRNE